ncbi:HTH domain-containing protein [Planctomicrobium piriforme]|uniref:HTH domain-containing protein n=1 Tax=Planctomicrobium piriforme TaxID=1576369 RepID=UPI000B80D099|nr:HTH domain-containing protein [Planctomicrobium piriforme]
MDKKRRPEVERRIRQSERLGRLLRLLHLIMGKGRWDADTLAEELGCSRRTIFRLLQTLSMAGVPWYFEENARAYRVRAGFKFPGIERVAPDGRGDSKGPQSGDSDRVSLIREGEALLKSLQLFLESLHRLQG